MRWESIAAECTMNTRAILVARTAYDVRKKSIILILANGRLFVKTTRALRKKLRKKVKRKCLCTCFQGKTKTRKGCEFG